MVLWKFLADKGENLDEIKNSEGGKSLKLALIIRNTNIPIINKDGWSK